MKQKGIAPIFILLLTVTFLAAGYLVYTSYSNNQTRVNPLQPTPTPSPTPTDVSPLPTDTGKTANWKTYTNSELRITFKYPNNWYARVKQRDWDVIISNENVNIDQMSKNGLQISILKWDGPFGLGGITEYQTASDYLNAYTKHTDGSVVQIDNQSAIKEILSGHVGAEYKNNPQQDDQFYVVRYEILHDNSIYRIEFDGVTSQNIKNSEQILNQILSTFKFLDQEQSDEGLDIIDGNVYKISSSGNQTLIVNKKDCKSGNLSDDYLEFSSFNISPDKSKVLLFGEEGLSIYTLCYTSLNPVKVKYISYVLKAVWSSNSQYIAFISKPADAGPDTIINIYDTRTDKLLNISNKPSIQNLKYDYLGFNDVMWLDDDSGIKVHYTAYQNRNNDPDPFIASFGAKVDEGEVILPVTVNK